MTAPDIDLAAAHRHFAVSCFNGVWELIDKPDRSPDEDRLMVSMCHASLYHWQQRPDRTSRSLSIGYWQLSRVYALLDRAAEAVMYGRLCLSHSEQEGPFHLGYAYEALARAALVSGNRDQGEQGLVLARQQAALIVDPSERELLEKDLESLTGIVAAGLPGLTKFERDILRQAVIEEVYEAFKDVSREGGVSWSETEVLDDYGSEEECLAARQRDKDTHWSQLVDDPNWRCHPGFGGFSFLDAIGFRYYLAAALMRTIRGNDESHDASLDFHLGHTSAELESHRRSQQSLLDVRQRKCVARCLLFLARESAIDTWDGGHHWLNVLDAGWWADLAQDEQSSSNAD